ncbi:hypothetical protein CYJ69_06255 [Gardnerella pickettii]|nr:hypothetical protein CYJ69_06255 [Gardnerella pickettii]
MTQIRYICLARDANITQAIQVSSKSLKKIKRSPVGKRKPTGAERKREEGFSYGVRERTSLMEEPSAIFIITTFFSQNTHIN